MEDNTLLQEDDALPEDEEEEDPLQKFSIFFYQEKIYKKQKMSFFQS